MSRDFFQANSGNWQFNPEQNIILGQVAMKFEQDVFGDPRILGQ